MACLLNVLYNSIFGPRYYQIYQIERIAKPGDLIAFDRGAYQHYALYIGNQRVINVGAEDMESTSALISEMSLEEIAGSSLARIENHDEFFAELYEKRPDNPKDIIRRARMHLGRNLPYEFTFRNCEYYCTLWRFGFGFSIQVLKAKPVSGKERYEKFAEHRATCKCNHGDVCHCTVEYINSELQILDLLIP